MLTGQFLQVGNNIGRPYKSLLASDDKKLIDQAYSGYKFVACYLETLIESKYNHMISHNWNLKKQLIL